MIKIIFLFQNPEYFPPPNIPGHFNFLYLEKLIENHEEYVCCNVFQLRRICNLLLVKQIAIIIKKYMYLCIYFKLSHF